MINPGIDFSFTVIDIANMEHTVSDGIVYTVHYTITRYKGGEQAGTYGSLGFEAPKPIESAIPYIDLTKETVVQWVRDKLTAGKVVEIEAALDAQIAEKLAPTKATGLPW